MKLELTIKTDYLPTWHVWEGIRELVQNGKDAEVEFDAPLTVRHRKDTNTLVIENEGATLPHEALLFGHTTKAQRGDLIGKFGEGLKLGTLALVRDGYKVKIRSGSEVWTPVIERSEKFKADVLVFYIETGRLAKPRVQVEVSNISAEEWTELQKCFLFLHKGTTSKAIKTSYGTLLLSAEQRGRIYVKGIYVQADPKLMAGYDFTSNDVAIDRDRKMLSRYDLQRTMRYILVEAVNKEPTLFPKFSEMLEQEAGDIADIDEFNASYVGQNVLKAAETAFQAKYGKNAVPVANLAEAKDLEHLGKRGIVLNKQSRSLLQAIMGTPANIVEGLRKEAAQTYSWMDLTSEDRTNLERAIQLVSVAVPVRLAEIDIVDFRSESIEALFDSTTSRILIAKRILADKDLALTCLVHEVAHRQGGNDGDKTHVQNIETIWSAIVAHLTTERE